MQSEKTLPWPSACVQYFQRLRSGTVSGWGESDGYQGITTAPKAVATSPDRHLMSRRLDVDVVRADRGAVDRAERGLQVRRPGRQVQFEHRRRGGGIDRALGADAGD